MKAKGIIIAVIVLLFFWAVIATTGAIIATQNEAHTEQLLTQESKKKEKAYEAYETLQEEYAELEEDCKEYDDKYFSEQFTRVVYEWLFDICANQENKRYDADASLERILRREYSWLNMEIVDQQTLDAVMSVYKQRAKTILLEYDIDIEIK